MVSINNIYILFMAAAMNIENHIHTFSILEDWLNELDFSLEGLSVEIGFSYDMLCIIIKILNMLLLDKYGSHMRFFHDELRYGELIESLFFLKLNIKCDNHNIKNESTLIKTLLGSLFSNTSDNMYLQFFSCLFENSDDPSIRLFFKVNPPLKSGDLIRYTNPEIYALLNTKVLETITIYITTYTIIVPAVRQIPLVEELVKYVYIDGVYKSMIEQFEQLKDYVTKKDVSVLKPLLDATEDNLEVQNLFLVAAWMGGARKVLEKSPDIYRVTTLVDLLKWAYAGKQPRHTEIIINADGDAIPWAPPATYWGTVIKVNFDEEENLELFKNWVNKCGFVFEYNNIFKTMLLDELKQGIVDDSANAAYQATAEAYNAANAHQAAADAAANANITATAAATAAADQQALAKTAVQQATQAFADAAQAAHKAAAPYAYAAQQHAAAQAALQVGAQAHVGAAAYQAAANAATAYQAYDYGVRNLPHPIFDAPTLELYVAHKAAAYVAHKAAADTAAAAGAAAAQYLMRRIPLRYYMDESTQEILTVLIGEIKKYTTQDLTSPDGMIIRSLISIIERLKGEIDNAEAIIAIAIEILPFLYEKLKDYNYIEIPHDHYLRPHASRGGSTRHKKNKKIKNTKRLSYNLLRLKNKIKMTFNLKKRVKKTRKKWQ